MLRTASPMCTPALLNKPNSQKAARLWRASGGGGGGSRFLPGVSDENDISMSSLGAPTRSGLLVAMHAHIITPYVLVGAGSVLADTYTKYSGSRTVPIVRRRVHWIE
jgi:hypothetical protein